MRTNLPTAGLNKALAHLRLSLLPADNLTDRHLLERFLANHDEAAFAALVQRHGRMVMGVCNRILGNIQDCEDVFQAVFFILARKAGSVVKQETLASWLFTVAHRASLEARASITRRRIREQQMADLNKAEAKPVEAHDWMPLLDRELNQLPAKYRTLIVLSDLEGKSRKEVAHQLGLKLGTLASRLARARCMLATRLSKYGLTVSGGTLAASLAQSSASAKVPVSLVWSTAKAATLVAAGHFVGVSVPAVSLMKGTMKMMFLAKLKTVIGTSIVAVALGIGGLVYNAELVSGGAQAADEAKPKSELEMLRKENELLKMNLRVTLEKIIAQEDELKKLKGQVAIEKNQFQEGAFKAFAGMAGNGQVRNGKGQPGKGSGEAIDQAISNKADDMALNLSILAWMQVTDKASRANIIREMETLIGKLKASEQQGKDSKGAGGR
jgi:RNA polymerase sigma factor (sigma-70 family)